MVLQIGSEDSKLVSDDHFNIVGGLTCGALDVWLSVATTDERDTDLLV